MHTASMQDDHVNRLRSLNNKLFNLSYIRYFFLAIVIYNVISGAGLFLSSEIWTTILWQKFIPIMANILYLYALLNFTNKKNQLREKGYSTIKIYLLAIFDPAYYLWVLIMLSIFLPAYYTEHFATEKFVETSRLPIVSQKMIDNDKVKVTASFVIPGYENYIASHEFNKRDKDEINHQIDLIADAKAILKGRQSFFGRIIDSDEIYNNTPTEFQKTYRKAKSIDSLAKYLKDLSTFKKTLINHPSRFDDLSVEDINHDYRYRFRHHQ